MMETSREKRTGSFGVKKNDLILAGAVIAAALVWFGLRILLFSGEGLSVRVTQDGRVAGVWPLYENTSLIFTDENGGKNTLLIQDGEAYISAADCPDRLCMRKKAISGTGESIICLPHRLVIEVTGKEESEVDAVVR